MPLTLRGEHGEQAQETDAFVERLRARGRAAGRDLRRALHLGPRRRRRRARGGAPALRLPPVAEQPRPEPEQPAAVARRARPARRHRRRDRRRGRRSRSRHVHQQARRAAAASAAAEAVPDRLPRGLHARADGRARRASSRRSPTASTAGSVKLNAQAYLAASRQARVPCFGTSMQTNLEGFLFPATYDFLPATTSRQLVAEQLQAFCKRWRSVDMAYARSKNLTPYDVLKIASMIEREAQVARRAAAHRGGDLQPPARADAARDRRDAALRPAHPADEVDPASRSSRTRRRTTRGCTRGCRRRRSRTRASPRCARPRIRRRSTTSTTCASPTTSTTTSRARRPRSTRTSARTGTAAEMEHVALLGHPVAHSLSPAMQNAAFAAAGLDWDYAAFDVEDPVAAVATLVTRRLRRRERHDPAQAGGRRGLRRGRRRRREHARLPRRPRARLQHRPGDPRRHRRRRARA